MKARWLVPRHRNFETSRHLVAASSGERGPLAQARSSTSRILPVAALMGIAVVGWALVLGTGCASAPRTEATAVARFFVEAEEPGAVDLVLPQSGVRIAVSPKPVLTEYDLAAVDVAQEEFGRCLQFRFTGWAARDLYRLSVAHTGRRLVLVINREPRGARRMERPIADGVVRVFVEVPDDTLPELAAQVQRTATVAREKN